VPFEVAVAVSQWRIYFAVLLAVAEATLSTAKKTTPSR
jgi:hypothetical protein